MLVPEVTTEQIDFPGLGVFKVEWLVRDVLSLNEVSNNLILHLYHVPDPHFPAKMQDAWRKSGLAEMGISIETSYTKEFEGYPIDAFDAILYGIDPCFAEDYKSRFIKALKEICEEASDERGHIPPPNRNTMPEMRLRTDDEEGQED